MTNDDFQELLSRLRAGDTQALGALHVAFAPALYVDIRLAWRNRPAEDIEDAVQNTFLALLKKVTTIGEHTTVHTFPALLRKIAWCDVCKVRRHEGVLQFVAVTQEPESTELAVDSPLELADELARVWKALDQLSPNERQTVVLRHHHGMSNRAIAELLNLPVGTIACHISRGLAKLRKALPHDKPVGETDADARTIEPVTETEIDDARTARSEAAAQTEVQK